jgi:uncharacterized protein
MTTDKERSIAIVGSGIAGLTAAHLLHKSHRVILFEKSNRLGGHTNTITLDKGPDAGTAIDTGFIVMNHRNYPLFTKLLENLEVPLRNSNMSFSYYDRTTNLQYSGSGFGGLFAQRSNLFSRSFHHMLRDVFRFFKVAREDLNSGYAAHETLREYLEHRGFGHEFIEHHLIPMGSAIWSTPSTEMMEFPADSFLRFFNNHGLLTVNDRPQWRTVAGGSNAYIQKMLADWNNAVEIRLNADISGITRQNGAVQLHHKASNAETFDHVILATHADQVLQLLSDPTDDEKALFSKWSYTRSLTHLHTDESVMPPLKKIWSSWNFQRIHGPQTCLTYHMNRLQGLDTTHPYFVSLNLPIIPENILYEIEYEHPMYTHEAMETQPRLQALNGVHNTWFTGSYFGNGFHEDAVRSSVHIAEAFGETL